MRSIINFIEILVLGCCDFSMGAMTARSIEAWLEMLDFISTYIDK